MMMEINEQVLLLQSMLVMLQHTVHTVETRLKQHEQPLNVTLPSSTIEDMDSLEPNGANLL